MQGYNPDYSGLLNAGAQQAQALGNLGAMGGQLLGQRRQQQQMQQYQQQQQQEVSDALLSGNPAAVAQVSMKYPELSDSLRKSFEFQNDATEENFKATNFGIIAAPENTEQLLTDRVNFLESMGADATKPKARLEMYRANPEKFIETTKGLTAAAYPKEFSEYEKAINAGKPEAMTPAQQVADRRAKERLNLDRDKLEFEKEKAATPKQKPMSVFTERTLNEAQNAAYDSYSSSDSIQSLADSYAENKGDLGDGFFGSAQESFKEFVGGEDEVTSLKKQYGRIKNSLVLKSLPQGPATDKDIEIFSKGFPSENADPEYIESFLRGMAKSQYLNGRFNEFKASYISEKGNTGGLMKAWKKESKDIKKDIDQKFPEKSKSSNLSNLSDEDLLNG